MNKFAVLLVLPLIVSGCEFTRAEVSARAKTEMIGMTKEEVLNCMGATGAHQKEGATEIWSYDSNAGPLGVYSGGANAGGVFTSNRICYVDIFFNNNKVQKIRYRGETGWIGKDNYCAYAVKNCMDNVPEFY